jgi:hypothetical protein
MSSPRDRSPAGSVPPPRAAAGVANGSGQHRPLTQDEIRAATAEEALQRQDWAVARQLWHDLACALPQNRHYRAQLAFARAGELLAGGDVQRAREELERVLRLAPDHGGATAMMRATRAGRISRLLRR